MLKPLNRSHPNNLNPPFSPISPPISLSTNPPSDLPTEPALPSTRLPSPRPLAHPARHGSKEPKPRRTPSLPIRIPIEPGHCLVFGRKPDVSALAGAPPKSTLLPITLPKSFTHASRTHCLCTLIAPPLGGLNIRILVAGQNGLLVDGERFEQGSSAGVELERRDGEQIELGFYGGKKVECYVKLDEAVPRAASRKKPGPRPPPKRAPSPARAPSPSSTAAPPPPRKRPRLSPPPSAPPTAPAPVPACVDAKMLALPAGARVRALVGALRLDLVGLIASAIVFSPRATVSTTEVVRGVLETQPSLAEAVLAVLPSWTGSPELQIPAGARECLSAPLLTSYVREGSVDTKPSASEMKHFGSEGGEAPEAERDAAADGAPEQGDARLERAVGACRAVVLETLQGDWRSDGTGMFGCVTNEGLKDASGEPLEALWYYQPMCDSDLERRANLQPYVRQVRHTQTTSKQYFFKKVRGSGRRKS